MAMSKKDYTVIANMIYTERDMDIVGRYRIDRIARALAVYIAEDNPRFDREKFLEACGII